MAYFSIESIKKENTTARELQLAMLECKKIWNKLNGNTVITSPIVTKKEKKKNEAQLRTVIKQIRQQMQLFPSALEQRKKWRQAFGESIKKGLSQDTIFGIGMLEEKVRFRVLESIQIFISKTRAFDDKIEMEDIAQAMSNFLVYVMMAELEGAEDYVQNAVWSYSLLYPYTDNILDDVTISSKEKMEFNERLYQRIQGREEKGYNQKEEKINACITYIEEKYNREQYPEIYNSILLIFQAQVESLRMQKELLGEEESLDISIFKGASSVLVNACMIDGRFGENRENNIRLATKLGYFLQLADDLRDMKTDIESQHQTLFTIFINQGNVEHLTNNMFEYIDFIFEGIEGKTEIAEFIKKQCRILMINSMIHNKEYFSKEYIDRIEEYSLVSIGAMDSIKQEVREIWIELEKKGINMVQLLDEMITEEEMEIKE